MKGALRRRDRMQAGAEPLPQALLACHTWLANSAPPRGAIGTVPLVLVRGVPGSQSWVPPHPHPKSPVAMAGRAAGRTRPACACPGGRGPATAAPRPGWRPMEAGRRRNSPRRLQGPRRRPERKGRAPRGVSSHAKFLRTYKFCKAQGSSHSMRDRPARALSEWYTQLQCLANNSIIEH